MCKLEKGHASVEQELEVLIRTLYEIMPNDSQNIKGLDGGQESSETYLYFYSIFNYFRGLADLKNQHD